MIQLALLLFVQDTVAETRLERVVSRDWDVFVEIDGVEAFVDGFNKSPMKKALTQLRASMSDLGAGDVLENFEKEAGVSIEGIVDLVKGQLAVAIDVPATFAAVAECRDAEAAKKLADLLSKGPANVRVDGSVVWLTSAKDFEAKPASSPLAEETLFKKARTLSGAARGGLFAYVDLTSILPVAGLLNDDLKKSGFAGLRAAATSLRFDAARVAQTHVLIGPTRPQGILGTLLEMKNEKFSLAACPKSTALRVYLSRDGVGTVLKLVKDTLPNVPPQLDLFIDPILKGAGPFGFITFTAGGGHVLGIEGPAAAKALEALVGAMQQAGVPVTKESVDGATVGELTMGADSPFGAYGIKGDRAVLAKDRKIVDAGLAAASESIEADFKPLIEGATFEGALLLVHDFTKYRDVIASIVEASGGGADEKTMKTIETFLALAGKNVDWIGARDGALVIESRSTSGLSIVTAAALMSIPGALSAKSRSQEISCVTQFKTLTMALERYHLDKGRYPAEVGSALWDELAKEKIIERAPACSVSGGKLRGPAEAIDSLGDDAIIGACEHDARVLLLRKNGMVELVDAGSELAKKALKETKE